MFGNKKSKYLVIFTFLTQWKAWIIIILRRLYKVFDLEGNRLTILGMNYDILIFLKLPFHHISINSKCCIPISSASTKISNIPYQGLKFLDKADSVYILLTN